MAALLALLLFVTIATAVFAFGTAVVAPASPLSVRLRSLIAIPERKRSQVSVTTAVLEPLGNAIPKSPDTVSKTRLKLMQAGYRDPEHLAIYFGLRALLALTGATWLVLTGVLFRAPLFSFIVIVLLYILPRFFLVRRIKSRQQSIRLGLPDALDLSTICMEAGLSLDQAIFRVGEELRHTHAALSEELGLVNLEMRAGKPRPEALRNLALRTGVDDVRALVAVLIQTDRFGTSLAQALRVHSDALRTERRQRAEEAAAKTTIKMVPVLIFFVFPPMLFVTLGPAAIQLIRNLLPVVQQH